MKKIIFLIIGLLFLSACTQNMSTVKPNKNLDNVSVLYNFAQNAADNDDRLYYGARINIVDGKNIEESKNILLDSGEHILGVDLEIMPLLHNFSMGKNLAEKSQSDYMPIGPIAISSTSYKYYSKGPYYIKAKFRPGYTYVIDVYSLRPSGPIIDAPLKMCLIEYKIGAQGEKISNVMSSIIHPGEPNRIVGCGKMVITKKK